MMQRIVGFVFARGGSKGVPGKNLRPLDGIPLTGLAIRSALASRYLDRVVVSTDCPEIAHVARRYGAEVPLLRPAELARDAAPERLAWRHAIEQIEAQDRQRLDVMVSVPPTCPLRSSDDIDRCIHRLLSGTADIVLTATESRSNPYFNMITIGSDGQAKLAAKPASAVCRRQDAPVVYDLTAVAYAARRDSVFEHDSIFDGVAEVVVVPAERAVDIDTEFDLELAEFLMRRRRTTTASSAV